MLLDANLLLYAVDEESRFHQRAKAWLEETLGGPGRVGLPWTTLIAFLRIVSHPQALRSPLDPQTAWGLVGDWLDCESAFIPSPTPRHQAILERLITSHDLRGNLIPDAHLAALAIEYGLAVASCDSDFARFGEVRWIDPLA
jgi:uncharacterized protein